MNDENESPWLQERMQELRERRHASAPTFEKVWRAARARTSEVVEKAVWPTWRLAAVSFATIAVAASAIMWKHSERENHRRIERDFAAVDGALLTYWQGPTDDLLPIGNWDDSPESR